MTLIELAPRRSRALYWLALAVAALSLLVLAGSLSMLLSGEASGTPSEWERQVSRAGEQPINAALAGCVYVVVSNALNLLLIGLGVAMLFQGDRRGMGFAVGGAVLALAQAAISLQL